MWHLLLQVTQKPVQCLTDKGSIAVVQIWIHPSLLPRAAFKLLSPIFFLRQKADVVKGGGDNLPYSLNRAQDSVTLVLIRHLGRNAIVPSEAGATGTEGDKQASWCSWAAVIEVLQAQGTTCGFEEFAGSSLNVLDTSLPILNPGKTLPVNSRGTWTAVIRLVAYSFLLYCIFRATEEVCWMCLFKVQFYMTFQIFHLSFHYFYCNV